MACISSALLLLTHYFIKNFDVTNRGLDIAGSTFYIYHTSRILQMIFIIIICKSLGQIIIKWCNYDKSITTLNNIQTTIIQFYLGASTLGLVGSALGLLGYLKATPILVIAVSILLIAHTPLGSSNYKVKTNLWQFLKTNKHIYLILPLTLIFILIKVLYFPDADGNIWEHYLHYYRMVVQTETTYPSEIWHHFYASKGAGLILIANVLGDLLSVQLVSGVFLVFGALIIYDLLKETTESACEVAP